MSLLENIKSYFKKAPNDIDKNTYVCETCKTRYK